MGEAKYEIIKKVKVLSQGAVKTKELNIVKWGKFEPMFDIRKWDNGEPGKGIVLTTEEAQALYQALGEELANK